MTETTDDACSTRAYVPGLGYILLSKREYEKTARNYGEYMRGLFEEGDRAAEREWRTAEYEIARVNNELVKAQKRIAALEAALKPFADHGEFIVKHFPDPETDQNHETATLVRHFRNAHNTLAGGKDD